MHIGLPARRHPLFSSLALISILLVAVEINVPSSKPVSSLDREKTLLSQQVVAQDVPVVLSPQDIEYYREAFAQQQAGNVEKADAALAQTSDSLLKGVLLGERYLATGKETAVNDIAVWLAHYGDYAQAEELYRIAQARAPEGIDLTAPHVTTALKGFSNGQDRSALDSEKRWVSGLAAFRRGDMVAAEGYFKALLNDDKNDFSSDDRAALAFWAYRASFGSNDVTEATKYLSLAASQSPGFYSILARQLSGERIVQAEDTHFADMDAFLQKDALKRAVALKTIGQDALAEKELRALFPASSIQDRKLLVQVARMLNLPAAQIRMAAASNFDAVAGDALYPMPHWTPTLGYSVEPALLFAIMRQESGFNPNAKSASGAMGVMQLMPATAHAMARDARLKLSPEPAVSMTLGQHYLERLMDISAIQDNLVYLIAAYNAGPGNVEIWQRKLHVNDDPLLFIESIPWPETRDYVVRVMGNYWVYSEMMGSDNNPSAAALAQNHWPHYERSDKQVALMVNRLSSSGTE